MRQTAEVRHQAPRNTALNPRIPRENWQFETHTFMIQAARTMTALDDGAPAHCRVLICDRDRKWSAVLRKDSRGDAFQPVVVV